MLSIGLEFVDELLFDYEVFVGWTDGLTVGWVVFILSTGLGIGFIYVLFIFITVLLSTFINSTTVGVLIIWISTTGLVVSVLFGTIVSGMVGLVALLLSIEF